MSDLRGELERVRTVYGELNAPNVVEAARPEDAPLHARFEWDNTIAGERWREEQARELIRSVMVEYKHTSKGSSSVRGYVSVERDDRRQYLPTDEALSDPFTRNLVLMDAQRELRAHRGRYGHLTEYADLIAKHLREVEDGAG